MENYINELPGISREQLFNWWNRQKKEFAEPGMKLQEFVTEGTINKTDMLNYRDKKAESINEHFMMIIKSIIFNGPEAVNEHLKSPFTDRHPYCFAGFKGLGIPFNVNSEIIIYKSRGEEDRPFLLETEFETEKQVHWRITSFLTFRLKK